MTISRVGDQRSAGPDCGSNNASTGELCCLSFHEVQCAKSLVIVAPFEQLKPKKAPFQIKVQVADEEFVFQFKE